MKSIPIISNKKDHIKWIDGLRAFALIIVVINHFDKSYLPLGYLGVDIFFVISGFVITSSLIRKDYKNFSNFITSFYERRLYRILPALVFYVLIASIATIFFIPEPRTELITAISSLFGLSNIYLAKNSVDYFATTTDLNPFTQTWSLGVEEQFYFIFPIIFYFTIGNGGKKAIRFFLFIVSILVVCSLIQFIYFYSSNFSFTYFMIPTRFWEIGLGSIAYFFYLKNSLTNKKPYLINKITSSFLIIFIFIAIIFLVDYPILATISVVTLTALSLCFIQDTSKIGEFFSLPLLRHIGILSYSLYLWHWGVLSISRITIGIHWWSIPLQIIAIYFLSVTSYFYIETPIRLYRPFDNKLKNIFIIILSLLSSTFIILPSYLVRKYIFLGNQPISSEPTLYSGKNIREICMKDNLSKPNNFLEECLFSNKKNSNTIFVAGDSHAESLTYSFSKLANKLNYDLHVFYRGGIIFPNIDMITLNRIDQKKLRNKASIAFAKHIENNGKPGDIVFITHRYQCYFGSDWNQCPTDNFAILTSSLNKVESKKDLLNKWVVETGIFAKKMQNKGIKIILTSPTPEFPQGNNFKCLGQNQQWFNRLNKIECQTNVEFFNGNFGIYDEINKSLQNLISANSNIYLLDLFEALCNEKVCNYSDQDINALYIDSNHLSLFANKDRVFPKLYKFMAENIKPKNNF